MGSQGQGQALLLVFAEPGEALPDSEFHDWYDSEHVPLRTALSEFKSATRFVQTDGQRPTWAATYDIASLDTLKAPEYTALMTERSARETDVLTRMEYLERRIYTVNEAAPVTVSADFTGHGGESEMTLVLVSLDVPAEHEAEFHRWYDEEHIPLLRQVPGWLRTRRFILSEAGATGALKGTNGFTPPPRFLALHEYAGPKDINGPEWKAAKSTPWRTKIMEYVTKSERRVFKVYKVFK